MCSEGWRGGGTRGWDVQGAERGASKKGAELVIYREPWPQTLRLHDVRCRLLVHAKFLGVLGVGWWRSME